jgi:hypothetical protein
MGLWIADTCRLNPLKPSVAHGARWKPPTRDHGEQEAGVLDHSNNVPGKRVVREVQNLL